MDALHRTKYYEIFKCVLITSQNHFPEVSGILRYDDFLEASISIFSLAKHYQIYSQTNSIVRQRKDVNQRITRRLAYTTMSLPRTKGRRKSSSVLQSLTVLDAFHKTITEWPKYWLLSTDIQSKLFKIFLLSRIPLFARDGNVLDQFGVLCIWHNSLANIILSVLRHRSVRKLI